MFQGTDVILVLEHGFLVAGFLGRYLGVEAGLLVFRVVQFGEAVGDLAADHE